MAKIKVEWDKWDWNKGKISYTTNITYLIRSYSFQKSIKSPEGSGELTLSPRLTRDNTGLYKNLLDLMEDRDVIRIYEYDVLKFVGYIDTVGLSGWLDQSGKPTRVCKVPLKFMGNILAESSVGLGMGRIIGNETATVAAAHQLQVAIADAMLDGLSYAELITVVVDNWKSLLEEVGSKVYLTYLDTYFDFSVAVSTENRPILPKRLTLYDGTETSINLWSILMSLVEPPFNELWIDCGPRKVRVAGKNIDLPDKKVAIVFRDTPFDGTVNPSNGVIENKFSDLPAVDLANKYLTRYDLSRSGKEAVSVFGVVPAAFDFEQTTLELLGTIIVSDLNLSKYQYKTLIQQLFYIRTESPDSPDVDISSAKYNDVLLNMSNTLKNWFEHNSKMVSGTLQMVVPPKNPDPVIGTRLSPELTPDGFFYVEAIVHQFTYPTALTSTLTVTRGYGKTAPISFNHGAFNGGRA